MGTPFFVGEKLAAHSRFRGVDSRIREVDSRIRQSYSPFHPPHSSIQLENSKIHDFHTIRPNEKQPTDKLLVNELSYIIP